MSQVANWWIVSFLNPLIKLVREVELKFEHGTFTAAEINSQPVPSYTVVFIDVVEWSDLLFGNAGEYFLSSYPRLQMELHAFYSIVDEFHRSVRELQSAIANSSILLEKLKDIYEMLIKRENVPRSAFEDYDLTKISQNLTGQLGLEISNYPDETRDILVRFTTYSLLNLEIVFPESAHANYSGLLGICNDQLGPELMDRDPWIPDLIDKVNLLSSGIKAESKALRIRLQGERLEIAKRYTTTF